MKVNSKEAAWKKVNEIFPTDYELDVGSEKRAGYPIYRSTADGHYYDRICDLGCRLEVVLDSTGEDTVNIWIEDDEVKPEEKVENSVSEERKSTARRIKMLCYLFTKEYINDMNKADEEKAACERMKENPDGEIKIMVLTGEQNAKVMFDGMKDCIRAINVLTNADEDVDDWMLAGINAMLDKENELHEFSFDLAASINGLLLSQYRK